MRGEQTFMRNNEVVTEGSPPHARGAGDGGQQQPGILGITPACAGSRTFPGIARARPRDHPRMRGEQTTSSSAHSIRIGSPPHARGAGTATMAVDVLARDHPRMRGEQ